MNLTPNLQQNHKLFWIVKDFEFEIKDCQDYEVAKELIREYSTIKGAEQCFVSLNKELADLDAFYQGVAYNLYKHMGFEEIENNEGTVSMKIAL